MCCLDMVVDNEVRIHKQILNPSHDFLIPCLPDKPGLKITGHSSLLHELRKQNMILPGILHSKLPHGEQLFDTFLICLHNSSRSQIKGVPHPPLKQCTISVHPL